MLTHVHNLAHFEKEVEFERYGEDGFLSLNSALLRNEVHIFYCAGGKFGEVEGVFLATRRWPLRHRMLSLCVRCSQCQAWLGLGTGRQVPDASLSLFERPVCGPFANLPAFKTGEHRTVRCSASGDRARLQTSLCLRPVCTGRVWWQLAQRPVLCRLPLDSDTWLTLEHRTQVLSVCAPLRASGDPVLSPVKEPTALFV